jgi:hypothetical protein
MIKLPSTGRGARPPQGSSCCLVAPEGADTKDCVRYLLDIGYRVSDSDGDLRQRIRRVCEVDFIVLIPGHEFSRQANIEVTVARALRLPLLDCGTLDIVWQP